MGTVATLPSERFEGGRLRPPRSISYQRDQLLDSVVAVLSVLVVLPPRLPSLEVVVEDCEVLSATCRVAGAGPLRSGGALRSGITLFASDSQSAQQKRESHQGYGTTHFALYLFLHYSRAES